MIEERSSPTCGEESQNGTWQFHHAALTLVDSFN